MLDRSHPKATGEQKHLVATLPEQPTEAAKLHAAIAANLKELGYGG